MKTAVSDRPNIWVVARSFNMISLLPVHVLLSISGG